MGYEEPEVVEPRYPDVDSEVVEPVAYGPEKPKRDFIPEPATRRRRPRWPWIVLGCLLAPCLCCVLGVGFFAVTSATVATIVDRNKLVDTGSTTLPLAEGEDYRLQVDSQVGDIQIRTGAADEVIVEWEMTAYGFTGGSARRELERMSVTATESGGVVKVVADNSSDSFFFLGQANRVNLILTVPESLTDLDVSHNVGDIAVDGVAAAGFDLRTNTGDIRYSGRLAGDGPYDAQTNVGSIRLELPGDARMDLNAKTDVGILTITGFETASRITEDIPGATYTGLVGRGAGSAPAVKLEVNVGDITITRR